MLGWPISIALLISYAQTHNPAVLLASGLFAIAGSIWYLNSVKTK